VIRQLPELWVHINHPTVDNRTPVLALTIVQLAMCAFLWLFPTTVAHRIFPQKETSALPSARLSDWQMLGVVLIGLWEFAQAIPRAFYWPIVIHTFQSRELGFADLTPVQMGQIAATLGELVVGACLVFGARTITTYVFGVREVHRQE
jgi:hypothetical protein